MKKSLYEEVMEAYDSQDYCKELADIIEELITSYASNYEGGQSYYRKAMLGFLSKELDDRVEAIKVK